MGKLRILSGKQVCEILEKHGFIQARQRGSHIVMQKQLPDTTITVPVPNHTEFTHRYTAIHHPPVWFK